MHNNAADVASVHGLHLLQVGPLRCNASTEQLRGTLTAVARDWIGMRNVVALALF